MQLLDLALTYLHLQTLWKLIVHPLDYLRSCPAQVQLDMVQSSGVLALHATNRVAAVLAYPHSIAMETRALYAFPVRNLSSVPIMGKGHNGNSEMKAISHCLSVLRTLPYVEWCFAL